MPSRDGGSLCSQSVRDYPYLSIFKPTNRNLLIIIHGVTLRTVCINGSRRLPFHMPTRLAAGLGFESSLDVYTSFAPLSEETPRIIGSPRFRLYPSAEIRPHLRTANTKLYGCQFQEFAQRPRKRKREADLRGPGREIRRLYPRLAPGVLNLRREIRQRP